MLTISSVLVSVSGSGTSICQDSVLVVQEKAQDFYVRAPPPWE